MIEIKREIIPCKNDEHWLELRKPDITSTDVSALFGISPYATKFELWHGKKGTFEVPFVGSERTAWGNRLESGIAYGAAEEHEWTVEPFKEYGRLAEIRIGSSFDFRITAPVDAVGVLEIKNLDYIQFQQGWVLDSNTLEAPPHIELQVQHQMLVAGVDSCHIAALVGGNQLKIIRRAAEPGIHELILKKCADFWKSVDNDKPPPPHFPPDSEFVAKLYGYARTGSFSDMTDNGELIDLLTMYRQAAGEEREAGKTKKEMKAKILMLIGDTEKIQAGSFGVSAGMVGPAHIEYDRKPYRMFKVTKRKE